MVELLKKILAELHEKIAASKASLARESQLPLIKDKIKATVGMRRVGKTYFLYQIIRELIEKKDVSYEQILYLNFEDDRLLPCSQSQFRELLESFYRLYPENHDRVCYLFLDEVQNVEEWPLVVRRFFDTRKVEIYLSGSSAKMLSKEIATSLRGRSITTEIWPYSFTEYLNAKNIIIDDKLFGQKIQDKLHQQLISYLEEGGFPEAVNAPAIDRKQLLQEYVDLVIMRDIVERYHISNISLIKYMIKTVLKSVGCGFSVNKFANDIKSQGLQGAKNTIYDYLNYIEDAYLAFTVSLFSESIRKMHTNPRKIYAIDSGLVRAFSFSNNDNFGHLFENLIYLNFRRQGCKVYYYLTKDRYEVDFLTEDRMGQRKLYQVVWDSSDKKTLAREMRALKSAEKELGIKGEIITVENYLEKVYQEVNKTKD